MYREKINLTMAKALELAGDITIVDASPESLPILKEGGKWWRDNFNTLLAKYPHISPDKLLNFLSAKYTIEVTEGIVDIEANTYSWRYLYGVENSKIKNTAKDDVEYIYILVNPGYPDLVKIGMTVHDVHRRATAINATATVEEWVPKFALPVKKGTAYRVEQIVHKFFVQQRVSSDRGNSREFFTLDPFEAFDKVREVGALFQIGNPISY